MAELAPRVGVSGPDFGDIRRPLGTANGRQQTITSAEQPGGILALPRATKGNCHAEQAFGRATLVALVGEDLQRLEKTLCGFGLMVEVMGDIAEVMEDIGKAERRGTRNALSFNVSNIRRKSNRVRTLGLRLRVSHRGLEPCRARCSGLPVASAELPHLGRAVGRSVGC
jgi:hypothetical protein